MYGEMRERLNRADSKSVEPRMLAPWVRIPLSPPWAAVQHPHCTRGCRAAGPRRDDRGAEGARLESVCTLTGYRGFESHSLRKAHLVRLRSTLCSSAQPRQDRKVAAVSDASRSRNSSAAARGPFFYRVRDDGLRSNRDAQAAALVRADRRPGIRRGDPERRHRAAADRARLSVFRAARRRQDLCRPGAGAGPELRRRPNRHSL